MGQDIKKQTKDMGGGASIEGDSVPLALPKRMIPEQPMREMRQMSSNVLREDYGEELLRIVKLSLRSDSHLGSSDHVSGWQSSVKEAFILAHADRDLAIVEEVVERYCKALETLLSNAVCLVKSEEDLRDNALLFFRKRHALELDKDDVGVFLKETFGRLEIAVQDLRTRVSNRFKAQLT